MKAKAEMSQEEIVRLTGRIAVQNDRLEEIRDTHRLESKSQSDQIEALKSQLSESEALLKASQGSATQNEEDAEKHKEELEKMQAEVKKSQTTAKEEEEKRVKAISLLKTVRQKLVKAEKEREDALKETNLLREKDKTEREKDTLEKNRLRREIDVANMEREKAVAGLRAQFDKEVANIKERHEKDLVVQRGQSELEAVTTKGTYTRDLAAKSTLISQLQASLSSVTQDKNSFFDELQLRQAEVESSQSLMESLQSQNAELQYQLRELEDRAALLQEELSEAQSGQMEHSTEQGISSQELARLLATTEAKYETKLAELQRNLTATERERNDTEAEWSRKLREKTKETDDLKRALGSTARIQEQDHGVTEGLQRELEQSKKDCLFLEQQREEMRSKLEHVMNSEASIRGNLSELDAKVKTLEQQVEEGKTRETQLRMNNKTLREELRKVQSSAALLEKQRNPGVGYWTARTNGSQTDVRPSDSSESLSRTDSPAPDSAVPKNDEDINMEYLRNVILQFLEHKEMRPNLVKVLSIIMRFTPQETRRLMAKV
ncbi:hypothetical protein CPB85DRAFT_1267758 [Mucidula mucida]|nr:hypothetical protein CPB85DRAFT_1267758 [Mucidula mucida]